MPTTHATVVVAADDPAYEVSADEYNAAHVGTNDHGHTATGDGGTLTYQPVDSDLTAIAALATTSYGRAFLALADAAAGRTALGLGTASTHATGDYQPIDSDLTSIAALATTSYGRGLLTLANQAALVAEALPAIDATGAATDITTRNVSTTAHGLAPKLPNDATKYLDGTGAYSVPGGGGGGGGTSYGQTYTYPTTESGDTYLAGLNAAVTDVSAFSTRDLLNSRVMHLQTTGASHDHRVRLTLGTTKAGAYDVACALALGGILWSSGFDTYLEMRGSTSADAQLFIARIGPVLITGNDYVHQLRMGGSTAVSTNGVVSAPLGTPFTVRFIRDGSNVITFFAGFGTAPLALIPMVTVAADAPYTETISGTLARIEFSIHTPSGATSTQVDGYVDWLASV